MLHFSAGTKFQQAQAKRLYFSECTALPVKCMVESYAGAVDVLRNTFTFPYLRLMLHLVGPTLPSTLRRRGLSIQFGGHSQPH